jgi:hypothetical protein
MAIKLADSVPNLRVRDVARERDVHPSAVSMWIGRGVLLASGERVRLRAEAQPGGWRISRDALDEFSKLVTADRLAEIDRAVPVPARRDDPGLERDLHEAGLL